MTFTPPALPELQAWLDARRGDVDAALQQFLPAPDGRDRVSRVNDAMRYSVMAGGKRLRPMLVLGAAEAIAERHGLPVGDVIALAIPAACAVELVHT